MTAAAAEHGPPIPALPPDASPRAIRAALIDEERTEFERAYQSAMAEAARTLDLTGVLDVLRNWRRIAWLTQRQGPEAHRRMLAQAERALRSGELPPDTVPGEKVKTLIRERLGL